MGLDLLKTAMHGQKNVFNLIFEKICQISIFSTKSCFRHAFYHSKLKNQQQQQQQQQQQAPRNHQRNLRRHVHSRWINSKRQLTPCRRPPPHRRRRCLNSFLINCWHLNEIISLLCTRLTALFFDFLICLVCSFLFYFISVANK